MSGLIWLHSSLPLTLRMVFLSISVIATGSDFMKCFQFIVCLLIVACFLGPAEGALSHRQQTMCTAAPMSATPQDGALHAPVAVPNVALQSATTTIPVNTCVAVSGRSPGWGTSPITPVCPPPDQVPVGQYGVSFCGPQLALPQQPMPSPKVPGVDGLSCWVIATPPSQLHLYGGNGQKQVAGLLYTPPQYPAMAQTGTQPAGQCPGPSEWPSQCVNLCSAAATPASVPCFSTPPVENCTGENLGNGLVPGTTRATAGHATENEAGEGQPRVHGEMVRESVLKAIRSVDLMHPHFWKVGLKISVNVADCPMLINVFMCGRIC